MQGEKQDKHFWDWLDEELTANRKKYENEPEVIRQQKINKYVELHTDL